uniref:Protein phosphatase inhibitor 2 n=1 Tax=Panagrolaimus superbus TaxID=310955 RepID=A0A914YKG0_9BILA
MEVEMEDSGDAIKPIECLKLKPKKSILKKHSIDENSSVKEDKDESAKAHFDEMNIMATHHPADKDYGHMKIDEPKTPYSGYSDMEDEEMPSSSTSHPAPSGRRVSLVGLEKTLENGIAKETCSPKNIGESSDEEIDDEEKERRREFNEKRKKHYVHEYPGQPMVADDEE